MIITRGIPRFLLVTFVTLSITSCYCCWAFIVRPIVPFTTRSYPEQGVVSRFGTFSTTSARTSTTHRRSSRSQQLNMVAVDTSEIKNGMTIEIDGEPYKVLNFSIMKQARGAAKTTIKFKNLMRGNTIENTYRSGEKFETAMIERKDAQFTYKEGNSFFFMDSESFEEVAVDSKLVGDYDLWISEGMQIQLVYFKGQCIEVVIPSPAIYEIVETEPNMKGNTAQGYTKPAVLNSGATIQVPGFVEVGQRIKVDTEKKEYKDRVTD